MGTVTEYLLQGDFCKRMAERPATPEAKARWLELAGKWLALADEATRPANDRDVEQERQSGTK